MSTDCANVVFCGLHFVRIEKIGWNGFKSANKVCRGCQLANVNFSVGWPNRFFRTFGNMNALYLPQVDLPWYCGQIDVVLLRRLLKEKRSPEQTGDRFLLESFR